MSEGEKRPFGKKPFGKKPFGKKPFEKKPFGKKPFAKKAWGEKKSWSEEGERAERSPEGGKPFGARKAYGERAFQKRPWGDRGEKGGFERKGGFRSDRGPGRGPDRGAGRGPGPGRDGERKPRGPRFERREESAEPSEFGEQRARPHLAEDELRYLGRNACLALFQKRPGDIVRVYVQRELAGEFKPLIEYCTQNRKSFHLVDAPDLERLTDSVHHQGVCVVAKGRRFDSEKYFFSSLGAGRTLVLYLDGVGNPHNLGAVLRSAAHFGITHVCVPADELSRISPAIYRTAEGAAEVVSIVRVDDAEKFLDRLQSQGFHLYAFEAPSAQSLYDTRLNEKSVFVFGSEVNGISGIVREVVGSKLAIPGSGAVESLNVSVVAAIAMAEFNRQASQKSVRIVKNKS